MNSNDQIILDQVLEQQREARAPAMSKSDFLELFVAEQVLKDYDMSDDELESGIVGSSGDGGIDGIYVFANGDLVHEDFDTSALKKNIIVEVVIIQAKQSASFEEAPMDRLMTATKDLFDLKKPLNHFKSTYNHDVRNSAKLFRDVYTTLAARFPDLRFQYFYASKGNASAVHHNVKRKEEFVRHAVTAHFSNAKFNFNFLGASELLALARRQPTTSFSLVVDKQLSAKGGYVALVKLRDFYRFISDDKSQLRRNLFEANVRDYQGATQVNEEIRASLSTKGIEDFWWLNNGVTIIAAKAVLGGDTLTIEDPQIVNGLQTSSELFSYFSNANIEREERSIMVRVIEAGMAESRDRIIKATNSQTSIPPASLRATDKIHRDIEEFLKPHGIFYDRRKNSHKNDGRPIEQIIGISLMAQAVMSAALQRPDDARARPSSLIKKDEDYNRIFAATYPIELYLVVGKLIKAIQSRLRQRTDIVPRDKNNILFYTTMHATSILTDQATPTPSQLAAARVESITDTLIDNSINAVHAVYEELGATDQAAKGPKMVIKVKSLLNIAYVN